MSLDVGLIFELIKAPESPIKDRLGTRCGNDLKDVCGVARALEVLAPFLWPDSKGASDPGLVVAASGRIRTLEPCVYYERFIKATDSCI